MEQAGLSNLEALAVLVRRAVDAGTDLESAAKDTIRSAGIRCS